MDVLKSQKYIALHRDETIKTMCRFLQTDTLLFWSDKSDLFSYQQKYWQPLLDVLNSVFKFDLQFTKDFLPPENATAISKLETLLSNMTDKELTCCFLAASEMKSVLLGFLFSQKKISAQEALEAAFLEELYQNKFWGEDVAALNLRERIKQNLAQIEECLKN